jgi:protein-S-isoprenylcysteine O-methyltransferase Ste14
MTTITEQGLSNIGGISCGREDKRSHTKAAVKRHKRWLQAFFWPGFLVAVVKTKPSMGNMAIHSLIEIVSYALVAAATVGRLWCGLYLRAQKPKKLCQQGPYSICRNPIYVFNCLGGIGVAVASGRVALMIGIPALLCAYYLFAIKSEEKTLLERYGKEYEAYCAAVPRMIPRFGRYWSSTTLAVTPGHYLRGIVKAMVYFWIVFALQLIDTLKVAFH